MGFFEVFCSESGLVLGGPTALMLIAEAGERFEPIALPVVGDYDRYAKVDLPSPLVGEAKAMDDALKRLVFDDRPPYANDPVTILTALNNGEVGKLDGQRVNYALVDDGVMSGIARTVARGDRAEWKSFGEGTLEALPLDRLFALALPLEISRTIHPKLDESIRPALVRLARFRAFGGKVTPVDIEAGDQFGGYKDGTEPFTDTARAKYVRYPLVLEAIEAGNVAYWRELDDD